MGRAEAAAYAEQAEALRRAEATLSGGAFDDTEAASDEAEPHDAPFQYFDSAKGEAASTPVSGLGAPNADAHGAAVAKAVENLGPQSKSMADAATGPEGASTPSREAPRRARPRPKIAPAPLPDGEADGADDRQPQARPPAETAAAEASRTREAKPEKTPDPRVETPADPAPRREAATPAERAAAELAAWRPRAVGASTAADGRAAEEPTSHAAAARTEPEAKSGPPPARPLSDAPAVSDQTERPDAASASTPALDEQVRMVEAILFASPEPLSTTELGSRLPSGCDAAVAVRRLEEMYVSRGVRLVRVAGKWAFRTASDLAYLMATEVVEQRKLSKAAIETLAIIAYHQPVTRADIEEIRQVGVSKGTLDLLMELEWVKLGRRRQSPGRPVTFVTTDKFLDHFGLESTKDLPGLDELRRAGLLESRPPVGMGAPMADSDPDGDYGEDVEFDADDDPQDDPQDELRV